MKNISIAIFLLMSCSGNETKNQKPLQVEKLSESEWATYEGRWVSGEGVLSLELSLKEGSVGIDSEYKLHETFNTKNRSAGSINKDTYSTYSGLGNKELGITLHNLKDRFENAVLRFKNGLMGNEEMFFITRGNDELLPCDNHFKPLTLDKRYTLHKRSKLFTAEGYFTIENDSAKFFERNTMEEWDVANLGEFEKMKDQYKSLAKEKFEGIYLKALAYYVADSTSQGKINALAIKRILAVRRGKGRKE